MATILAPFGKEQWLPGGGGWGGGGRDLLLSVKECMIRRAGDLLAANGNTEKAIFQTNYSSSVCLLFCLAALAVRLLV